MGKKAQGRKPAKPPPKTKEPDEGELLLEEVLAMGGTKVRTQRERWGERERREREEREREETATAGEKRG